jgi:hypothetical protein
MVLNAGAEDEFLTVFGFSLDSDTGANFLLRSDVISIGQDGKANVTMSRFEANLVDQHDLLNVECELGTGVRFKVHRRKTIAPTSNPESLRSVLHHIVYFKWQCDAQERRR